MPIRLSAGVIVVGPDNRIALVRHLKPGVYDFWVAPGGGVEDGEDFRAAAAREAFEAAGLHITPERLIAIEQLSGVKTGYHIRHWFVAHYTTAPPLQADRPSTDREGIVEGRWMSRAEMTELTVYPPLLGEVFWLDLDRGFPEVRIMDMRAMTAE